MSPASIDTSEIEFSPGSGAQLGAQLAIQYPLIGIDSVEQLARQYFHGESPLGKHLRDPAHRGKNPDYGIVGGVGSTLYQVGKPAKATSNWFEDSELHGYPSIADTGNRFNK